MAEFQEVMIYKIGECPYEVTNRTISYPGGYNETLEMCNAPKSNITQ